MLSEAAPWPSTKNKPLTYFFSFIAFNLSLELRQMFISWCIASHLH